MNEGDVIFLSASVPVRKGWVEDAKPAEIEEAIVSIARAVFARKGRLLFGGHPSVSPLVAAVAGEYFAADSERRIRPIVTFQSRFYEGRLPDETTEMARMGWSAIEWTPKADGPDLSLRLMRDRMLLGRGEAFARNGLRPPRAMIAVGGMDGVRDEAYAFLCARRKWEVRDVPRVYLFKSGGGAAARLLDHRDRLESRLWPGIEPDFGVLETLMGALRSADILDVEDVWRETHRDMLPAGIPFEPYAAMAQWVVDALPASAG